MIAGLLLAAALSLRAAAAPAAAPYDDAKAAYDAGEYDRAASAFAALLAAAPGDAALHYDLGNALLKAGRLGRASASYQRAFDLDPRDGDVRHNLDFVLTRSGEESTPPGVPKAAFAAFTALSSRELAGLHWLAAWTSLIIAGLVLLGGAQRRERLGGWLIGAAAAWLVFGLWWAGLRAVLPPGRGVIVAGRAELRNGPGEKFTVGYTAPEGRRVRVLSESGDWLEVGLLKEGVKGWILASSIEKL
ncbi:MAG: tetratricopeptide repeat protein [Elusimicrobia bacterium]|nr:tetratricopeptide repeat protein [Elusimicrobiota bacterium]